MQVEIRHSPSNAVARCQLAPNESMKVQPGAMMAMSTDMRVEANTNGGFFRGIGRMIGGENFFTSTFTAGAGGGWVDIIPELIGDVFAVQVSPSTGFRLTKGAWLANDGKIDVKPDASFGSMFAGEGLVVLKAEGTGTMIVSSYGGIDVHSLGPGDSFVVDTKHLVGWESTVRMQTRPVAGLFNSWKSKEGLVCEVTGPGDVITQTRVPTAITTQTETNNNFGFFQ